MTPLEPIESSPLSRTEKLEEQASLAGLAAAEGLRAVEVAAIVLIGLLVCPPLAILVVVVVVPLFVATIVLGLLAAILTTPYLLFHHFRNPEAGHISLLGRRLRRAGRAVIDLAPHRIVADARSPASLSGGRFVTHSRQRAVRSPGSGTPASALRSSLRELTSSLVNTLRR